MSCVLRRQGLTDELAVVAVNSVAWAPYSVGYPMLACASADGDISILSYKGIRIFSFD